MKVSSLMTSPVVSVREDATVGEAVLTLSDQHVSALPVVDSIGRLIGLISASDILQAEGEAGDAASRERLLESTTVSEIMTRGVITIGPDTAARDAARQLLYSGVHRLIVAVDDRPVGVLSQTDLVAAMAVGKV